jgi:hypothetical protein
MANTITRTSGDGHAAGLELFDQISPQHAGKRLRWSRVVVGACVAVFCGVMFVALYDSAGGRHPVLAIGRPVPAFAPISASDLTTVRIANDPALAPVPVQDEGSVIGRRAAVALVPGTLLTAADVGSGPLLGAGQASVGLALNAGQVPAGLVAGDSVLVIETPPTGQGAPATFPTSTGPSVLVNKATVLSVSAPTATSGNSDTQVTLAVPADLTAQVAVAASANEVALAGLGPTAGS